MNSSTRLNILFAIAVGVVACKKETAARLPGEDVVLARVQNTAVTQYDLDQAIESSLGPAAGAAQRESVKKNVLESLVKSRALALEAEKDLTPGERLKLERQVAQHREELLVKRYLAKHAPPEPVTDKMIEDYYAAHLPQYGGKSVRSYELVGTERSLSAKERDSLIAALKDPGSHVDWQKWTEELKKAGEPVVYRNGEVVENVVHPRLQQLMTTLKPGEASSIVFVDGRGYVVRVTAERQRNARPLSEVRDEIRQTLASAQLRDAVKRGSEMAMKNVRVALP